MNMENSQNLDIENFFSLLNDLITEDFNTKKYC